MIKYSKVYRNHSTVIPIVVKEITKFKTSDIIKWTINKKINKITIQIIPRENASEKYVNQTIKSEDYVDIYRNISQRRHIIFPVEIEEYLEFDNKIHLIKWNISEEEISIEKSLQVKLLSIAGILDEELIR